MPFKRSHGEHVTGYRRTRDGQLENKRRAAIARTAGNKCPICQPNFGQHKKEFIANRLTINHLNKYLQ